MNIRRERRRRKKGSVISLSSLFPWLLGTSLIVGIAVFMIIKPPAVDPKTFCDEKGNIPGVTVILVDVSDKLSFSQKARLNNELKNISETSSKRTNAILNKGEKLVVYFLEQEGIRPFSIFSMCHPGDSNKRSLTEYLFEGDRFAKKKWEMFSSDTINKIENKIDLTSELSTSPIIETIQYIRSKEFPPPDLITDKNNYRLIIWSDMIQNSRISNHFNKLDDVEVFFKENPFYLNDIKVTVFQVRSKKYKQYQSNEQFMWWRKVFSISQGELVLWEPL